MRSPWDVGLPCGGEIEVWVQRHEYSGHGGAFPALGGIDRATSVVILTHDPKLDDAALGIALRSDAPYVGAMGSRRAQARRREA
jgi:xanthine/CO dehydrogenase XdhC/CoxF family maturation factor